MSFTELLRLVVDADTRGAVREVENFGRVSHREFSRSEQSLDRWGSRLTTVGAGLVSFGAVAAYGLNQAAQSAGRLEQAVGGTEAVFDDATGVIDRYARSAAESAGLSESAFREATTQIGGNLKRLGVDVNDAAQRSVELTQVAADLAATYGGTTAEAVTALGAAFRGEADPAERFNLDLRVSKVNAEAVALGLASSTSAVSDHARAQALLSLIMKQSADAQGQFGRESDTLVGRQQILAAQFENLKADIGEGVIPAMQQLFNVAQTGINAFSGLNDATGGAVGKIATIATVGALGIGGLSILAGSAIKAYENFSTLGSGISRVTARMGGLGAAAGWAAGAAGLAGLALALKAIDEARAAEVARENAEAFVALGDGATEATANVIKAFAAIDTSGGFVKDTFAELRDTNVEAAERFIEAAEAAGVQQDVLDGLRASLEQKREADVQGQVDQESYNESVDAGAAALESEADAIDAVTDALDALHARFFDVNESIAAQNQLVSEVDGKLQELTATYGAGALSLDLNTEAGRQNVEMLSGLFEASEDTISTMLEQGATSQELRGQWAQDRAELSAVIERFRAAGVDVSAYDALLGEIDEVVRTQVFADTGKAAHDVADFAGKLRDLDGDSATVSVNLVASGITNIAAMLGLGKRALGGPVMGGRLYEVAEQGRAELLEMGSHTYLIPGSDGTVVPAGSWGGGGGGGTTAAASYHYHLTFNGPTNDVQVVEAIKRYERSNGPGWRN